MIKEKIYYTNDERSKFIYDVQTALMMLLLEKTDLNQTELASIFNMSRQAVSAKLLRNKDKKVNLLNFIKSIL